MGLSPARAARRESRPFCQAEGQTAGPGVRCAGWGGAGMSPRALHPPLRGVPGLWSEQELLKVTVTADTPVAPGGHCSECHLPGLLR